MKEIKIETIENIKIGHAHNLEKGSGCTVVICEKGAPCGLDVRGGGPASRESELLKPTAACDKIHAVLLSGGSAFGLDAAGGVMQYLEEKDIGLDVGVTKVPLVCSSCLFDLALGDTMFRPDKKMGYDACVNAETNSPVWGNVGAGCGASVGKIGGMQFAMKTGIGSYALEIGKLKIGAIVALNALGDVYNPKEGKIIAGMLKPDKSEFANSLDVFLTQYELMSKNNTTLAAVITNAKFDKTQMNKVAQMAQDAYARCIKPIHTTADGDSVYAMSCGDVLADVNVVGTLAAEVVEKAILNAVKEADKAFGLESYKSLYK